MIREAAVEIENHLRTLGGMLLPLCRRSVHELAPAEKRVLPQLLEEVREELQRIYIALGSGDS